MPRVAERLSRTIDHTLARASIAARRERPCLISILFHGLHDSLDDARAGAVDPFQPFTVADFERLITHFRSAGYRFVTPGEIAGGLAPTGRYIWLTFDDGYANNLKALPIMRRHGVPATFFVSAGHVRDGRSFWWDALYRSARGQGWSQQRIWGERERLKELPFQQIESHVRDMFGRRAFEPLGDDDRPMTGAELADFAADPLVTIGNHTVDHAILTTLSLTEARGQIRRCQSLLADWVGYMPTCIAYPNGIADSGIIDAAQACGLVVGVLTERGKEPVPVPPPYLMRLRRHAIASGSPIDAQCKAIRADLSLTALKSRLQSARRRGTL